MAGVGFYGTAVTYPGGSPATNEKISVFLSGTDTLAELFNDVDGVELLDNPVTTDNFGYMSFYTEQGEYELEVRDFRSRIFIQGTEGEPGPPGEAAGIEFVQSTPLAAWSIEVPEELGRKPNVTIYVDGDLVMADVQATESSVFIQFPTPVTGSAVLS